LKKRFLDENARWVLSYLKPHTLGLIGILAISFGQSYAFTMLPKASTNFLFELLRPDNIHLIYKYFLLALGLIVIKTVFAFISNYGSEVVVSSAIKNIRNHLFSHLMTLDFGFYSNQKTGDIISISVNDVQEIRGKFYNNLITFISSCMMFTIIMVRLFLLNWLLTLICMGFMPALYIVIRIIGKKLRIVGKQLRKSLADLSVNYHETLTAIDVVKAFSNEEHEKDSFRKNTNKHRTHYLHLARLRHILRPLNEMIIYFFGMTLIGIGSIFILRNTWSVKHLTEYLMLLGIMSAPLRGIPTLIPKK
jgi:ABC-type multidrug transport system fused ATPase/permease subunit